VKFFGAEGRKQSEGGSKFIGGERAGKELRGESEKKTGVSAFATVTSEDK